ncbi:hypothetical protein [Ochrobactrum sp. SFR4]|uniref:DUF3885 domain-containing protein n=1 Tax=Ochrobactrum sp. SFR4 TaxID=2717368 RepID=UPI001C8C2312|nr:hypothetical protein [Ochrobactrum sp. SFR4]MBX8825075.1 hypothetical protein [Ochrobactrum sp. SFR4]
MYLLREEKRQQWVRFYALPEGKRYPSNESEQKEILKRYNSVAGTIFAEHEPLWLVSDTGVEKSETSRFLKLLTLGFKSTGIKSYTDEDGEKCRSRFFYKQTHWKSGAFNDLFSLVVNEKISGILFVNQKTQMLYMYDGGMDVILPDTAQLNQLKERFEQWRSPLVSGL